SSQAHLGIDGQLLLDRVHNPGGRGSVRTPATVLVGASTIWVLPFFRILTAGWRIATVPSFGPRARRRLADSQKQAAQAYRGEEDRLPEGRVYTSIQLRAPMLGARVIAKAPSEVRGETG